MSKSKSDAEVIDLFHKQVNMSPDELEAWLEGPESKKAGTGVGLESGRRIVEILRANPERESGKYSEEDMEHIRKVVGYNSRHLKQEDHLKDTKTTEQLEHTKSTISLRNWGHDPVKVKRQQEGEEPAEDEKERMGEEGEEDAEGDTDDEVANVGREEDASEPTAGDEDQGTEEDTGDKRKRNEDEDEKDVEEKDEHPEKVARRTRSTARAEEDEGGDKKPRTRSKK